ncbi:MAG: hypothetical protein VKL39_19560 [Leptolyngbyaceae bacterium]|nr:hypothetical protein [Leptolyngbyaceae bacterium]
MDSEQRQIKGRSPLASTENRTLDFGDTYICPVCRHGHISQLTMMDAFACDFCRHIFEIHPPQQTIRVVDSAQPLLWHWNGRNWTSRSDLDESLTIFLWMISVFLTVVPASIIGLSAYVFPPLPNSPWFWFPFVWAIATFLAHLTMVSWLMAEHYQFPIYVLSKLRIRRWLSNQ